MAPNGPADDNTDMVPMLGLIVTLYSSHASMSIMMSAGVVEIERGTCRYQIRPIVDIQVTGKPLGGALEGESKNPFATINRDEDLHLHAFAMAASAIIFRRLLFDRCVRS
jgi:hypothetical protein